MTARRRVTCAVAAAMLLAASVRAHQARLMPVAELVAQAAHQVQATARVPLGPESSSPNYLRVLSLIPGSAEAYANAFKTVLYGGTVEPETKMAMALQIGRVLRSSYTVVHLKRILATTGRGQALLKHLESGGQVRPDQALAVQYAEWLTRDVHGVDDERFRQVRGYYTDPQIVELTMTVSFFNYFTRLVEAAKLPVESWALKPAEPSTATGARETSLARVGLISDAEMEWASGVIASRNRQATGRSAADGLGLGLVNSQRAMNLVPDVSAAWRGYTGAAGEGSQVTREIKLHVSFAVSMSNGCRYCTLHQVQGLRRLGVSIDKLMQMKKDDSALTPRELAAVIFARRLTIAPADVTDAEYNRLRAEFGERGALEVVLQTCNFAFMNRFTDNLGLPSEDEAIQVYREVYGADYEK